MTLWKWSTTAATNNTVDSTINYQEGQSPASLNNSARAAMAAIAKYRDDISGNLVTTGTSTAYAVTTNQGLTALTDGFMFRARVSVANGASPTINVDSLGAKPIRDVYGTTVDTNGMLSGSIRSFTYDSTDDAWLLGETQPGVPPGTIFMHVRTDAPAGWVRANGRTIGDASSSATERADDDTAYLFALLWAYYSNTVCPVSGGRGASSAADYAAHKTIGLPDLRGRAMFGLDDMGNSAASVLTASTIVGPTTNGASGGAEQVILNSLQIPSHTHSFSATTSSDGAHTHTVASVPSSGGSGTTGGGSISQNTTTYTTSSNGAHTHTVSGTSGSAGSSGGHTNIPPAFLTTFIIKL